MKKNIPLSVSFVLRSKNKKLGDMAATYASIKATCPKSCKLKNNGCYAELGNVGVHVMRHDASASLHKKSSYRVAQEEAALIMDAIRNGNIQGRPLRLHVSGDARTDRAAKAIAVACEKWHNAGGGHAFGYTHSWKKIERNLFGSISMLASIDAPSEANEAIGRGYAPASIFAEFPNGDKAFRMGGVKFIPCPNQTKGITCKECKLCMNDGMLRDQNAGIAFIPHGIQKNKVLRIIK